MYKGVHSLLWPFFPLLVPSADFYLLWWGRGCGLLLPWQSEFLAMQFGPGMMRGSKEARRGGGGEHAPGVLAWLRGVNFGRY